MSQQVNLSRIRQIGMNVHDLAAAKAFYGEKLGLKLALEVPRMVFFDCGGTWLMLALPESEEGEHKGSVLYFEVDDIQRAYEALRERGVAFIDEPHRIADMGSYELWMTFFRDPERTVLALRSEIAK